MNTEYELASPRNSPRCLSEIVENGMCIGCGLCQSIAGSERVEMMMVDPPGRLRPTGFEAHRWLSP